MKKSRRKNQIALSCLVLFLGAAVLVNWYYNTNGSKKLKADNMSSVDVSNADSRNLGDAVYVDSSEINNEYFASAKLSRDESYDEAVATLKEIIDGEDSDEQSVKTANQSLDDIANKRIMQVDIENTVKAKTGSECVAVISEDSVKVIIDSFAINDNVILQIKDIVTGVTDYSSEKISIIGAK